MEAFLSEVFINNKPPRKIYENAKAHFLNILDLIVVLIYFYTHIGERPSICAPLGPCNTWPGKGRAGGYWRRGRAGVREGVMNVPGDTGRD